MLKNCKNCDKSFKSTRAKRIFCKASCRVEYQREQRRKYQINYESTRYGIKNAKAHLKKQVELGRVPVIDLSKPPTKEYLSINWMSNEHTGQD